MAHPDDGLRRRNTDLVLPVGKYAYIQDLTNGGITVHVGPTVVNTSGTEQAVIYDHDDRSIVAVPVLDDAARPSILVEKGAYAILENPASTADFPGTGKKTASAQLQKPSNGDARA